MPFKVSVIIPCFNEEKTIHSLLMAIYEQDYPRSQMEVVIADGISTDGTRKEIEAFTQTHPDLPIQVVDNPKRNIPSALNIALKASRGEIIIRLDGHSKPYPDYVKYCVSDLESNLGEVVGGTWEIRPGEESWVAGSIALAASHPLGVGDALYRHATKPAYADTVPFGSFKRELLALVGFFDESLLVNEDYEFNTRVRQSGGRIWMNPGIRSVYYARGTLASLITQYWRYGYWKSRMLRRYPRSLRWRQALPPGFVISLLGLTGLGFLWGGFHIILGIEIFLYFMILVAAGMVSASRVKKISPVVGLPVAISSMHFSWGLGFLWGIIKGIFSAGKKKNE